MGDLHHGQDLLLLVVMVLAELGVVLLHGLKLHPRGVHEHVLLAAVLLGAQPVLAVAGFALTAAPDEALLLAHAGHAEDAAAVVAAHAGGHLAVKDALFAGDRVALETRLQLLVGRDHTVATGCVRTRVADPHEHALVAVVDHDGRDNEVPVLGHGKIVDGQGLWKGLHR